MTIGGRNAVSETEAAFVGIVSALRVIHECWLATTRMFEKFVDRPRDVRVDQALELVNSWRAYEEALDNGIISITKSIDFILIEPIASRRAVTNSAEGPGIGLPEMLGCMALAAVTYVAARVGYRSS